MARASAKSPEAFRTISEAADALDLPQHVLRFWETRFSQIKPMKRSGGRRYYRPGDIALLQGIRHLLYDEGYTIKGVQRILREQGIAHVVSFADQGPALPDVASKSTQPKPEPAPQHSAEQSPPRPDPVRAALANPQPEPIQPEQRQPQPAQPMPPTAPVPVASPPLMPSSGLRFVAEPEPDGAQPAPTQMVPSQPASPQPAVSQVVHQPVAPAPPEPQLPQSPSHTQPLPNPVLQNQPLPTVPSIVDPATPAPTVAQPTVAPGASEVGGQLAPHQTESLVKALRTLMECKSQLDQARPAPTASSASAQVIDP